jgi:hypothetical protein
LFELFNEPVRIINADVKLIPRAPEKRARKLAQFARGFSGERRQLRAARPVNQTFLQIDSDPRVRSLE